MPGGGLASRTMALRMARSCPARIDPREGDPARSALCDQQGVASDGGLEEDRAAACKRLQPCGDGVGAVRDPGAPGPAKDVEVKDGAGEVPADDRAWRGVVLSMKLLRKATRSEEFLQFLR